MDGSVILLTLAGFVTGVAVTWMAAIFAAEYRAAAQSSFDLAAYQAEQQRRFDEAQRVVAHFQAHFKPLAEDCDPSELTRPDGIVRFH